MSSKRKKQPLHRNNRESDVSSLILPLAPVQVNRLDQFSEEFVNIGRRTYEETTIHSEIEKRGYAIPYLDNDEASGQNPLYIHYHRADMLRRYHRRPPLLQDGIVFAESSDVELSTLRDQAPRSLPIETNVTIRRTHVNDIRVTLDNQMATSRFEQDLVHRLADLQGQNKDSDHIPNTPFSSQTAVSIQQADTSPNKRDVGTRDPGRTIQIGQQTITFNNNDVRWPHGVIEFNDDIPRLFREWEASDFVTLKGFPVPMKLWAQVFRRVRSEKWENIKKKYSEFKAIVSVYQLFNNEEEFWKAIEKNMNSNQPCRKKWLPTLKTARKIRQQIDDEDAARAHREYTDAQPGFNEIFAYRKGGEKEKVVMTAPGSIAQKYRALNGCPRPWDHE